MDIINNKKSLQVYKLASLQVIYVLSTLCGRQYFFKIQTDGVDCGESTPHILIQYSVFSIYNYVLSIK